MSGGRTAHQWTTLDRWWDAYVETQSPVLYSTTTAQLNGRWVAAIPGEIDAWWDAFVRAGPIAMQRTAALDEGSIADFWEEIDPWWDTYGDARQEYVAELNDVLAASSAVWERRGDRFNVDPLSTDWSGEQRSAGPLRPNQEENWSQWLAHLIRSAPGEFHRQLFGDEFATSPQSVQREVHLSDPTASDRYADILTVYGQRGISIEIKKGDEGYEKTPHTAYLVERRNPRDWRHVMLLPEFKLPALRRSFDDEVLVQEGDRPEIISSRSGNIEVLYWADVSRVLRTILLSNEELAPHWAASAYLFCTLIEQEIVGFTPQPPVERMAAGADVIQAFASVSVAIADVEAQIEYLAEFVEDDTHE